MTITDTLCEYQSRGKFCNLLIYASCFSFVAHKLKSNESGHVDKSVTHNSSFFQYVFVETAEHGTFLLVCSSIVEARREKSQKVFGESSNVVGKLCLIKKTLQKVGGKFPQEKLFPTWSTLSNNTQHQMSYFMIVAKLIFFSHGLNFVSPIYLLTCCLGNALMCFSILATHQTRLKDKP
jgi:hypothetical protein